jgi:ribosomal-protein-alanine N-acetyltransferase
MILRGPQLTLRYPRPDDAQAMFDLASDPEVVRHFSWGPYTDISEPEEWIAGARRRRDAGKWLEFVITRTGEDVPLGVTGLTELTPRDRRATIGTWLGRPHWGTGVNREAKALLLTLAFGRLGLQRVTAFASPDNPRSLVALERLGFTREGLLSSFHVHRGEPRDVAILGLLREDWASGPLAAIPAAIEGDPPAGFEIPR